MIRDNPDLAGLYFAATSSLGTYRMRKPDGEFIEFCISGDGCLASSDGWSGEADGGVVRITNTPSDGGKKVVLEFKDGKLSGVESGGLGDTVEFSSPILYEGQALPEIWGSSDVDDRGAELWAGGDRLRLWYNSPNQLGAVLVPLMLVALWGCIRPRMHVAWRIACALALAGEAAMLFLTKSRGSAVALAAGIVVLLAARRGEAWRKWKKLALPACLVVLLAVSGMVAYRSAANAAVKASDSRRITLLEGGLKMLRDAPCGWGTPSLVGMSYSIWYAPLDNACRSIQRNLVNEHFTSIVALGWARGAIYMFVWIFPLALMLLFAASGGSPLPAAIWTALNVSCTFNVILGVWSVWLVPLASLGILALDRRWLCAPTLRRSALTALAATLGLSAALSAATRLVPRDEPPLHLSGGALTVGNGRPMNILVDDRKSLGGISMPIDVRRAYAENPALPPLMILSGVEGLPNVAGCVLTLAGRTGEDFIRRFADSPDATPPASVVFLSPTFPPSSVPRRLLESSDVRYVIGEFAARYFKELVDPPAWCTVVQGAEVYIPGWVACCFCDWQAHVSTPAL